MMTTEEWNDKPTGSTVSVAPTPDFILGWRAARQAAAQISGLWGASDGPSIDPEKAETATGYEAGWVDGKLHAQAAIRALPPPGDLRAALAAMVKPLVWEGHSDDQRSGDYVITPSYGQGPKWLLLARGSKLVGWFDELELARAAAEADNCRRAVASIMGDEG